MVFRRKFFLKSTASFLPVKICFQIQHVSGVPHKSFNLYPFSENKPKNSLGKQRRGRELNPTPSGDITRNPFFLVIV
jgi:hypothetical protein